MATPKRSKIKASRKNTKRLTSSNRAGNRADIKRRKTSGIPVIGGSRKTIRSGNKVRRKGTRQLNREYRKVGRSQRKSIRKS